jgi:cytoskeleton protein RodZ
MRLRSPRLAESTAPRPSDAARIGEELRAARRARGETIEMVAETLRIRSCYLAALEEGAPERLPGPLYVRGFLRSYGDYLGLSGRRLVAMLDGARLESARPMIAPPVPPAARHGAHLRLATGLSVLLGAAIYGGWHYEAWRLVPGVPAAPPAQAWREDPAAPDPLPAPVDALAEARAAGSGRVVLVADDGPAPSLDALRLQAPDVALPPRPAPSAAGPISAIAAEQVELGTPPAPGGPGAGAMLAMLQGDEARPVSSTDAGRVMLVARDTSWIQVRSAARDFVRTRTLTAGERMVLPERTDLALWTGNAGAVELWVDGQLVGTAGAPGRVVRDLPLRPEALLANRRQAQ